MEEKENWGSGPDAPKSLQTSSTLNVSATTFQPRNNSSNNISKNPNALPFNNSNETPNETSTSNDVVQLMININTEIRNESNNVHPSTSNNNSNNQSSSEGGDQFSTSSLSSSMPSTASSSLSLSSSFSSSKLDTEFSENIINTKKRSRDEMNNLNEEVWCRQERTEEAIENVGKQQGLVATLLPISSNGDCLLEALALIIIPLTLNQYYSCSYSSFLTLSFLQQLLLH